MEWPRRWQHPLMTIMTTISTRGSPECSLAVLSTRLGQQDEQLARDRWWINELSQQLCDTTTQIAHISKVLDCLFAGCTPTATPAEVPAVPGTSSVSGATPPGQASSLLQQSTASGEVNPSTSTFHINGQAASHAGFPQSSWDLQEQALSFQDQAHNSTLNHSVRPFLPFADFLTQFPLSLGAPALGHHLALNQQQHPQATVTTGLPRGHPAQHHGWHLLQQIRTGYPSGHGISAIQFTDSYQCTQHGNGYSYHGQGDPQCTSETTARKLYRVNL